MNLLPDVGTRVGVSLNEGAVRVLPVALLKPCSAVASGDGSPGFSAHDANWVGVVCSLNTVKGQQQSSSDLAKQSPTTRVTLGVVD